MPNTEHFLVEVIERRTYGKRFLEGEGGDVQVSASFLQFLQVQQHCRMIQVVLIFWDNWEANDMTAALLYSQPTHLRSQKRNLKREADRSAPPPVSILSHYRVYCKIRYEYN